MAFNWNIPPLNRRCFEFPNSTSTEWEREECFSQLMSHLDLLNHGKGKSSENALIAEVVIVNGHPVITADGDLRTVAEKHGCNVGLLAKYTVP